MTSKEIDKDKFKLAKVFLKKVIDNKKKPYFEEKFQAIKIILKNYGEL